jgi:hypothetical protein
VPDIDLYADENRPLVRLASTTYRVSIPRPAEVRTQDIPFVYVEVDYLDMISIDRRYTNWDGLRGMDLIEDNRSVNSLLVEIYAWLVEWELAEWRRIGPEDSELFATSKLIEVGKLEL